MFTRTAQVFQMIIFCLLFFMFFVIRGHWCLRNVNLRAPEAVRSGESLTLSCTYVLEREKLYSVKFYLGDSEFYRLVPRESPPTRVFRINRVSIKQINCPPHGFRFLFNTPNSSNQTTAVATSFNKLITGITDVMSLNSQLQESRLNSSVLTLHRVHRDMTGHYKCEVSADAPLFHTLIKSSFVTVTEEPLSPPYITADRQNYSVGTRIRANCTSRGGYPPANLTWYLNGQQVVTGVKPYFLEADVDCSVLELHFQVSPSMTEDGLLRLRCVATQFNLYYSVIDLTLQEETLEVTSVTALEENGSTENSNVNYLVVVILAQVLQNICLQQHICGKFT